MWFERPRVSCEKTPLHGCFLGHETTAGLAISGGIECPCRLHRRRRQAPRAPRQDRRQRRGDPSAGPREPRPATLRQSPGRGGRVGARACATNPPPKVSTETTLVTHRKLQCSALRRRSRCGSPPHPQLVGGLVRLAGHRRPSAAARLCRPSGGGSKTEHPRQPNSQPPLL